MFTGLVEAVGTIDRVVSYGDGRRLEIRQPELADGTELGDSIAIDGVCLTAVAVQTPVLAFQAGPETLSRTTLGQLKAGSRVNLERALAVGARLGGHFVQGHVDGVGRVDARQPGREWETWWFAVDRPVAGQMVAKGSVAVDGISLTLVDVQRERFSVALIPHTLAQTTLQHKREGDPVNIETDILGKYVRRFLGRDPGSGGVDMDLLRRTGFA